MCIHEVLTLASAAQLLLVVSAGRDVWTTIEKVRANGVIEGLAVGKARRSGMGAVRRAILTGAKGAKSTMASHSTVTQARAHEFVVVRAESGAGDGVPADGGGAAAGAVGPLSAIVTMVAAAGAVAGECMGAAATAGVVTAEVVAPAATLLGVAGAGGAAAAEEDEAARSTGVKRSGIETEASVPKATGAKPA